MRSLFTIILTHVGGHKSLCSLCHGHRTERRDSFRDPLMRFLADHDVYFMTIKELRRSGHDVITAKELQMQESDASELLAKAKALDRIFISRDKDFGTLVFLRAQTSPGVIFLRISPLEVAVVHQVLQRLLQDQPEELLRRLVLCRHFLSL